MRRSKGRPFSQEEVSTISRLLGSTDLTLQEIAMRMSCAKSSIIAVNQHLGIRNYQGRKSSWIVDKWPVAAPVATHLETGRQL